MKWSLADSISGQALVSSHKQRGVLSEMENILLVPSSLTTHRIPRVINLVGHKSCEQHAIVVSDRPSLSSRVAERGEPT